MTGRTQNLWVFGSFFQFYLALYQHLLYFYFSFHVRVEKNLCFSPTSVKKVLLELHVFKCDRWMVRRNWTSASTVVVVWVWTTLDLEWIVDCPIFRFSYPWFQLGAIFLYLLVFLRMCFYSHWALCGKVMAIIFVPGPRRLIALNFWIGSEKGLTGPAEDGNAVVKYKQGNRQFIKGNSVWNSCNTESRGS